MSKKQKPVCVWVARDNDPVSTDMTIFTKEPAPSITDFGVMFNGDTNLKSIVRRLGIKKGDCRKFQLVEVKQ